MKVYIAGPYSSDPLANTEKAIDLAEHLAQRGFIPYVPHLSHYWDMRWKHQADFWYQYDYHWLECCDCLIRLPGESRGADNEMQYMIELGKPVFLDVDSLLRWYKEKNIEIT